MTDQEREDRIALLEAQIASAYGWGAAIVFMSEELKALKRGRPSTPSQQDENTK